MSAPPASTKSPASSGLPEASAVAMILATGQMRCYDERGQEIPCAGSGQDGEFRAGRPWPSPRFRVTEETVLDLLTGLVWSRDANLAGFPLTWQESLDFIASLNRDEHLGFADWRLPNRRELRSLLSFQEKKPALPAGHPFAKVFLGWYWSATSAAIHPAYAWYVHMEGARMFYGRKEEYCLLWPVRGGDPSRLAASGQQLCHNGAGREIPCPGSGQDGDLAFGRPLPFPRFRLQGETALDLLTGLTWLRNAEPVGGPLPWQEGTDAVRRLNEAGTAGIRSWRLPNINELESLVDCGRHSPALPASHPFSRVQDTYWSSTTSVFETDWAWALYLDKGATGVGHKKSAAFHIWPVADARQEDTRSLF